MFREDDEHVAKELADKIQREEAEKLKRLEIEDKKLAEQIQVCMLFKEEIDYVCLFMF